MSTRHARRPRARTYIRDTISYLGGWGLIVHQVGFVPRGDFNLWALLLGGLLVGAPGLAQLMPSVVQIIARQLGTELPPSPPLPEASRSSPPSSSTASEADR